MKDENRYLETNIGKRQFSAFNSGLLRSARNDEKTVQRHCGWAVRLRSLPDGASVSERSRRHLHCGHLLNLRYLRAKNHINYINQNNIKNG